MVQERIQKILVISKAFRLIRTFDHDQTVLSLAELAKKNGLNPVTAYRILQTLVDENILTQNPGTSSYQLGYGLVTLGELAKSSNDLLKVSYPHVEKLAAQWGETSIVDVMDHKLLVNTILLIPSTFRMGMNPNYDQPAHPHCTSTGKLMLAHLPPAQLQKYLDSGLEAQTTKTIVDPQLLVAELEKIRKLDYATNIEEQEIGFAAIGAPLRDMRGQIIGAVSVGGPTARISDERIPVIVESVKQCAQAISIDLGYQNESVK